MNQAQRDLLDDPQFLALVKQKSRVSGILTALMLLAYFGFVLLLAFAPTALSGMVGGDATWGIPMGIGVIVFAWILTGIYVRWANSSYDTAIAEIKARLEKDGE